MIWVRLNSEDVVQARNGNGKVDISSYALDEAIEYRVGSSVGMPIRTAVKCSLPTLSRSLLFHSYKEHMLYCISEEIDVTRLKQ